MRRSLAVKAIMVLAMILASCATMPVPVASAPHVVASAPHVVAELPPELPESPVPELLSPSPAVAETPMPSPDAIPPVLEVPSPAPPAPREPEPLTTEPEAPPQPEASPEPPAFDPASVSVEKKQATLVDARTLIEKLSMIILAKDYDTWVTFLSEDYRKYYSSTAVLAKFSESAVLRREGTVLRNLKDYFLSIVFRSRQSARLDDIEFIGEDRILALMINPRGERIVLYYLEKQDDVWKIGIGR
ncbi:MAG: hypothetical protein ACOYM2_05860 [Rectinemataceae bacterium]